MPALKNPPAITPEGRTAERLAAIEYKQNLLEQRIANPTGFSGYRAGAYKLTAGGSQQVPIDTVVWDYGKNWDAANHRYVVPTTGFYFVSANITATAAANKSLYVEIWRNAGRAGINGGVTGAVGSSVARACSIIEFFETGQHIELAAFNDSNEEELLIVTAHNRLYILKLPQ
jgi:hypothetical protein